MKTTNLTESTKVAANPTRPQQETSSSAEVAALRDKVKDLEKNIPTQEAESKNEGLLATYQSGDKALLEAEGITKQQINALALVTTELKQVIDASRSEIESSELLAKASEYETRASENGAAYKTVLSSMIPEVKQEMASDDEHSDLLKEAFKCVARAGQEGMTFWADRINFWTGERKAAPVEPENKEKIGKLYDQAFTLETQMSNLLGSGSKEEKENLKSQLAAITNQISAVRSGASA